jgi:hypothetical protein
VATVALSIVNPSSGSLLRIQSEFCVALAAFGMTPFKEQASGTQEDCEKTEGAHGSVSGDRVRR